MARSERDSDPEGVRPDQVPTRASGPAALPVMVVGRPEPASRPDDAAADPVNAPSPARRAMSAGAPAISSDGRYVAFVSESGDLVDGDANDAADVFVRDMVQGRTVLVSRSLTGGSGAGSSLQPAISADGRFVAFTSSAPDLVEADSNGSLDVFVHDMRTTVTTLVSRGSNGELADNDSFSPSLSADGRFVAYSSLATNLDSHDHNAQPDVYLHDRLTGRTVLVSAGPDGMAGDGPSGQPSVSANGRLVAFTSAAHFDPDDRNEVTDVYLHDMRTQENELVSRSDAGEVGNAPSHGPSLAADGLAVAFASEADNLADGDTNRASDVYLRERDTGTTRLVSSTPEGQAGGAASHSPSLAGDGRRVAFLSGAGDLAAGTAGTSGDAQDGPASKGLDHGYVRDMDGAATALVSSTRDRTPGDGETGSIAISSWGRHVAFADDSTDLAGQEGGDGASQVYTAGLRITHLPAPGTPQEPDPQTGNDGHVESAD
jgi:Tol biopolymer transport system component